MKQEVTPAALEAIRASVGKIRAAPHHEIREQHVAQICETLRKRHRIDILEIEDDGATDPAVTELIGEIVEIMSHWHDEFPPFLR